MKNLFILLPLLCLILSLNAQQLQPATVKAAHDGDSYKSLSQKNLMVLLWCTFAAEIVYFTHCETALLIIPQVAHIIFWCRTQSKPDRPTHSLLFFH
ncbi:MAG: hypothetical protein IPM36_01145 [Lewinellaceae bacterium]|nr:hypothetical protein [Lewinellaceae bacterium]